MIKGIVNGVEKDIVRIPMKGKNLFDGVLIGGHFTNADFDTAGDLAVYKSIKVWLPVGTYTFSFGKNVNVIRAIVDGIYSQPAYTNISSRTITSTTDGYVGISFRDATSSSTVWDATTPIMLNLGSTPLPYEPYGYQEGWEVRKGDGTLIWGRNDTLSVDSGTLPVKGYGVPLKSAELDGNMTQDGTPTPDAPIMPTFCGTLDGTDWKIPITCAGQTVPVYLGQTQTTRKIRKMRLLNPTSTTQTATGYRLRFSLSEHRAQPYISGGGFCNIAKWQGDYSKNGFVVSDWTAFITQNIPEWATEEGAAAWLEENEVYIWYVLANEETGIVNEPLMKIGTYADTLTVTDQDVTITPAVGNDTITVDTTLPPSKLTVVGHVRERST